MHLSIHLAIFAMAHPLLCSLHASKVCPSEICVGLRQRQVQISVAIACRAWALAFCDSSTVAKHSSMDEVPPKMGIHGKDCVPECFPKDGSGGSSMTKI